MTNLKTTDDLAIPIGSLILVTGTSGYIAINIAKEALDAGFKVRGTVRSQEKADLTKKILNNQNYEIVIVEDMAKRSAFDEAVKGVDAIIHVASVLSMEPDPSKVIIPTVHAAVDIMRSALKEPKVRRFVYSSSSTAATFPKPNQKFHLDRTTWNVEAEPYAEPEHPLKDEDGFHVYGASKTLAEKAVWKFAKENNPHFTVNSVLPNFNMGHSLGGILGVSGGLINKAYHGDPPLVVAPQYMINVVDDARIHLAAALDKTITNDRIYAFDSPFSWNDVLVIFKELRPGRDFYEPDPEEGKDLSIDDNELGAQLLRKWWGQDGYTGLRKSVEQNIANES